MLPRNRTVEAEFLSQTLYLVLLKFMGGTNLMLSLTSYAYLKASAQRHSSQPFFHVGCACLHFQSGMLAAFVLGLSQWHQAWKVVKHIVFLRPSLLAFIEALVKFAALLIQAEKEVISPGIFFTLEWLNISEHMTLMIASPITSGCRSSVALVGLKHLTLTKPVSSSVLGGVSAGILL